MANRKSEVEAAQQGLDLKNKVYTAELTTTKGPWLGPHYGGALTTELVLLVVAVAAALWLVVNRPAVATDDERIETALRRASAHRVLRAPTAALLLLAGLAIAVAAVRVLPAGEHRGVTWRRLDAGGALLLTIGALALIYGLGRVAGQRVPDEPPRHRDLPGAPREGACRGRGRRACRAGQVPRVGDGKGRAGHIGLRNPA